jgi:hypothetical protein
MPHPRDEVEAEFERYVARTAAKDWNAWADQFTEDARYVEHGLGTFEGRETIREWVVAAMAPASGISFPVDWHMIDGDRVVMYHWNTFDLLPGMTGEYRFSVVTILHYAGDGLWSYQEDVYNAKEADAVLADFLAAVKARPR